MENYTDKVGNKLNELLEKTYDAEKGFKKAADNATDARLKRYFEDRAQERYNFGHDLKREIKSFGKEVEKGDSLTSKAHRFWMDTKALFSTDNDEAMLEEAIRGEKASLDEYREVLAETSLPSSTRNLLTVQKDRIANTLNNIKVLEDIED